MRFDDLDTLFLQAGEEVPHSLRGVVAVRPKSLQWHYAGARPAPGERGTYTVVQRVQIPLAPACIGTLHSLQGATAEGAFVAHWDYPSRLSHMQKWLAYYVMLSRPRSLNGFAVRWAAR